MGAVPNRTSYELHLPAELGAWYSLVELQRTGRSLTAPGFSRLFEDTREGLQVARVTGAVA